MSSKKKVQFNTKKKVKKFTRDEDEYSGSDSQNDNSDSEINIKRKKHTLDSDEEDESEKYKSLNREFMNEIGQEAKTKEFDDDIKLTPFNMREELEEGDFDTDGYYITKKKDDIKDAWLDNVDWANINTFKNKSDVNTATKEEDDEESSESENESILSKEDENNHIELFKKMIVYLKSGETVLKAIKRLGSSSASSTTAGLSASQRWSKKKQTQQANASNLDPETVKADKQALETLTGYANQFIDRGFYDIYDETFEKIQLKLRENSNREADSLDIFADNVDEKVLASTSSQTKNIIEDSIVKWFYKIENTEEATLNGPFTSLQMLQMSEKGDFKESGVWCRKANESSEISFYNSKRIDFDLYT